MKKIISFMLVVLLSGSLLSGCGAKTSNDEPQTKGQKTTDITADNNNSEVEKSEADKAEPLDLTGLWVQEDHGDSYMVATIQDDGKMGVFYIIEGDDEPWTYWVGTYEKPKEHTEEYSWTSESTYGGNGLLASDADSKEFSYKNEKISYEVTIDGEKNNISLIRGEWDTSKIPDSAFHSVNASNEDVSKLELKDSGWYIENGEWLYYYVSIYNPNEDIAVELPSFRITARDANGTLLGTEDQTISIVYPKQTFVYGFQAFSVDEEPSDVEFEILDSEEYNLKRITSDEEFKPLEVVNTAVRSESIVGEIKNSNNNDIDSGIVVGICKDADGKVVKVVTEFVDNIKAGTTTPFSISEKIESEVETIDYYANTWN